MTAPTTDPFAGGQSIPAISFADAEVNTTYTGVITAPAELVQGKEFGTDQPAVWKNKDGSTSPKYSVVLNLNVDGEERSLWAVKPSAMFQALKDALQASGKPAFEVGGTLAVRFTGTEPAKNKGFNPRKTYAAKYTPPTGADPFSDSAGSSDALSKHLSTPGDGKFPDTDPPW
jgi:hypothetical protein